MFDAELIVSAWFCMFWKRVSCCLQLLMNVLYIYWFIITIILFYFEVKYGNDFILFFYLEGVILENRSWLSEWEGNEILNYEFDCYI